MKYYIKFTGLISVLIFSVCVEAKTKVLLPNNGLTANVAYVALLKEALKKSGGDYFVAESSSELMTETRYIAEVTAGSIDLIWTSTSVEKEKNMLPIRIPIDKGLLGYRINFISKNKRNMFSKVKTLKDLQKFTIGQGVGWGDIELYRANNLQVEVAAYENLFAMVAANRFDLYPRGIGEVPLEVKRFGPQQPNLMVEEYLCIYYPWPYYFFVNKKKTKLRDDIEKGLKIMMEDGSFDAHFEKYYMPAVKMANLSKRNIVRIKNPLLPPNTPVNNSKLWYVP